METNCSKSHDVALALFWHGVSCDAMLKKQAMDILDSEYCELQPDFMGFLGEYYHLSNIIPEGRIVYDLGCYCGFQSWFFRNHKKYVGVDMCRCDKFQLPNTEYYTITIADFIALDLVEEPHFAICNYVPPWIDDNEKLVRDNFRHLFVFYPQTNSSTLMGNK